MPGDSKSSGANSSSTSSRGRGDESTANAQSKEHKESRSERHSTRKAADEATGAGSARDSRSSMALKDSSSGEARSGSGATEERAKSRAEDTPSEDKAKKRSGDREKPVPNLPQETTTTDRSSASAQARPARSRSPIRRKPVPTAESPLYVQEHKDGHDARMDYSSPSSDEDMDSDYDESREQVPSSLLPPGIVPPPPPPPPPPHLTAQEQEDLDRIRISLAQDAEDKAKLEDEQRQRLDRAIAQDLHNKLNSAAERPRERVDSSPCMPGDFPELGESSGASRASVRSSLSLQNFWSSPERQLEKYKEKYASAKELAYQNEKAARHYQGLAQQQHDSYMRLGGKYSVLEMELTAAKRSMQHMENELKATKHELGAVKQQLSDAVNLSEVRGKELKGAQVFLTKADTLSVTDVMQKVHALNEEIFQMAAFLGEVLVYDPIEEGDDGHAKRQQAVSKCYPEAHRLLGEWLASTLVAHSQQAPKEPSNPLLVQIVMQVALTSWCANLASRWTSYQKPIDATSPKDKESQKDPESRSSIRNQIEHDTLIKELYERIRDNEDQAVAGRWRSLTRAHIPFSPQGWDHNLMIGILSVMNIAGWTTRTDEESKQIETRLASIFKPLLDLRKATGEDVTSADLEISIVHPGQPFEPVLMEDAYADGRNASKGGKQSEPEVVINTSGLGLQKFVVKRVKGGGIQKQIELLALPKVVLEKTIKEALEPPPPARKRKPGPKAQAEGGGSGLGSFF